MGGKITEVSHNFCFIRFIYQIFLFVLLFSIISHKLHSIFVADLSVEIGVWATFPGANSLALLTVVHPGL